MTASNAAEGEDVGDDKGSYSPPDDKELTAADPDDPIESLLGEVRREAKLLRVKREIQKESLQTPSLALSVCHCPNYQIVFSLPLLRVSL